MTTNAKLNETVDAFVRTFLDDAANIFQAFRDTGTLTANGTVSFVERIPGEDKLVAVNYPGPFHRNKPLEAAVLGLDGTRHAGNAGGAARYLEIFKAHPEITSVSHVHTPNLGAWAQTHRTLPFTYVPVQRFQLARELPVYVDRRQDEADFILQVLKENPRTPAIIEANGGSTAWGWKGVLDLAEFILLLEEGADVAIRAEAIGGARPFGPGVLRQQWKMSGLFDTAASEGLLPHTDSVR